MMAAKTRLALDWILIGIYSLYRLLHPPTRGTPR